MSWSSKRNIGRIARGCGFFLLLQLVPYRPPVASMPPETSWGSATPVLTRSCLACHARPTSWPWYQRVAPLSWWIASRNRAGRARLDLEHWNDYPRSEQAHLKELMWEVARDGTMPPSSYLWFHPEKRLTPTEIDSLLQW
jgi:hypothetical protein